MPKQPKPGSHQDHAQAHAKWAGKDMRDGDPGLGRYEMRKSNVEGLKAMKENKQNNKNK